MKPSDELLQRLIQRPASEGRRDTLTIMEEIFNMFEPLANEHGLCVGKCPKCGYILIYTPDVSLHLFLGSGDVIEFDATIHPNHNKHVIRYAYSAWGTLNSLSDIQLEMSYVQTANIKDLDKWLDLCDWIESVRVYTSKEAICDA